MPLPITFGAASARGFGLFSALAAGNTSWIGLFGGTGYLYGRGVALDSFGDVYFVGYSNNSDIQLNKYTSSGIIQWQKNLNLAFQVELGYGLAIDSLDNIYVCGISGNDNIAVVKYNSSGTVQWQRSLGGAGDEGATSIAIDSSNNIYIAGYSSSSGNYKMQIAKYNSSGTIQWQQMIGPSTGFYSAYSVAIDSLDNLYIGGYYLSGGQNNFLIAKYDSLANTQWQRQLTSSGDDVAESIAIDSSNNIYICGYSNASGTYELLLAKYDSSGTIQWQRILGGASNDFGLSIAIDSSNDIYISGYTEISVASNTYDLSIVKYDTSGTVQWQRRINSSANIFGYSIAVDNSNHIYLNGGIGASVANDFFIAKLPKNGTLTGTYTVGSYSFTYAATTFTSATSSLSDSSFSITNASSSLTDAASSLVPSTTTFTSTVTNI